MPGFDNFLVDVVTNPMIPIFRFSTLMTRDFSTFKTSDLTFEARNGKFAPKKQIKCCFY